MKDFEQLTDEEQQDVIMSISTKLDKQEIWYWMGLVHLLREQDKRIKKALEIYENRNTIKYKKKRFMEDKSSSVLMYEALKGSSNV